VTPSGTFATPSASAANAVIADVHRLPAGWHVVTHVPMGDTGIDLDHVVIGPGGLFVIHVECHPGAAVHVDGEHVLVDGQRHRYVRHSRYEANRASALLTTALGYPVTASGVVVFTGQRLLGLRRLPDDVHVTGRRGLVRWLESRPMTLSPYVVELLYTAAAHSVTWSTTLRVS
jgi:Nuclease-related domain